MVDINPEIQKTRRERMVTVIAVGASTFAHLFLLLGGIQFYQWTEEEKERERLMVIRRIQQQEPEPPPSSPRPSPSRQRAVPDASLPKKAPDSPQEQSSRAQKDLEEITDSVEEITEPEEEATETAISVLTDHISASFTISGPAEYFGSGKFWMKQGAPPGEYTATFHPVPGHRTPPLDTKTLAEEAMIAFVGKYTQSVEVKVQTPGTKGATFKIIGPDGSTLDMTRTGSTFFEDLKAGSYTIVYNDVSGFITPSSSTSILGKGGNLSFTGRYRPGGGGGGDGDGRGSGYRRAALGLDRRVKMIVKSYPGTAIEGGFPPIVYPEVLIKRGDFQKGWCQVYLVLSIDSGGGIRKIRIERPKMSERERFKTLIATVEQAVVGWEYEGVEAEIHVDVRFYVE